MDHEARVVDESYGAEAAAGREERVGRLNTWKLADPEQHSHCHRIFEGYHLLTPGGHRGLFSTSCQNESVVMGVIRVEETIGLMVTWEGQGVA